MDRREIASPTNSLQKNFAAQEHAGPYAIITGQLILEVATTIVLLSFIVVDFVI